MQYEARLVSYRSGLCFETALLMRRRLEMFGEEAKRVQICDFGLFKVIRNLTMANGLTIQPQINEQANSYCSLLDRQELPRGLRFGPALPLATGCPFSSVRSCGGPRRLICLLSVDAVQAGDQSKDSQADRPDHSAQRAGAGGQGDSLGNRHEAIGNSKNLDKGKADG